MFIGLIQSMLSNLEEGQSNLSLPEILAGSLTLDKYGQIIKPFIFTKSAPDSLAGEIRTKANTEAVIMILDKAGVIKFISNKFFLSRMQMSMKEKVQIMETFGAANISFFGEAVRIYSFDANTVDAPSQDIGVSQGKYYYQSSILKMYNTVLRGSQLIKDGNIAIIKVANHVIYGYPLNLNVQYNASQDPVTQFSLQFVVAEHSLELPGVVTEDYLANMYSIDAHINNQAILDFKNKIENITEKINKVLDTAVGEADMQSDSSIFEDVGDVSYMRKHFPQVWHIKDIQNFSFRYFTPVEDKFKTEYTSLLLANVATLQTAIGSSLDGEISPLVHSKVPPQVLDRLLALIPSMFENKETYNLVAVNFKTLIQLKKELGIFKMYRINRGE